jgi:hypothetical protein
VAAQAKKGVGKSKLSRIIILKVRSNIPTSLGFCEVITEKVSGTEEAMAPQATRRGREIKLPQRLRNPWIYMDQLIAHAPEVLYF